jgi:DNA-binding LytR/AlgR family response regulator
LETSNFTPVSVLAVEDDPIQQASLSLTLEEMGYACAGLASAADEALAQFQATDPDVVLLDIHLKGETDGIELGHQINRIRPTPLVYLTSFADDATFARARMTRPAAYLIKPVQAPSLQSSLENALRQVAEPEAESTAGAWESDLLLRDSLFVKIGERLQRLRCTDIQWVETAGNRYCRLVTAERAAHVRRSLTEIQEKLTPYPFLRVHRSYLINVDCLEAIYEGQQTLRVAGAEIPLGETYREAFFAHIRKL